MHFEHREMNYLIYYLWGKEEGWRVEEERQTWWNLINALITFVSPAVLVLVWLWDVKLPPMNHIELLKKRTHPILTVTTVSWEVPQLLSFSRYSCIHRIVAFDFQHAWSRWTLGENKHLQQPIRSMSISFLYRSSAGVQTSAVACSWRWNDSWQLWMK